MGSILRHRALAPVALAIGTTLAYAAVLGFGFVEFDDRRYVIESLKLRHGLGIEGIRWAFGSIYFANWHPITTLTYLLDFDLYALDARGYHATNLAFHVANTVLLGVALERLTGRRVPSLFVAAIFGLHPLHVESVAWIAERKDVVCGFFWMLTLIAYADHARRPTARTYLAVVAGTALALLSKPMAVTLPCVLALLDFWPLRRFEATPWRRLVLEKLPLLALAGAIAGITLFAQTIARWPLPLDVRLANAALAYATYVFQTLWPADLCAFYPHAAHDVSLVSGGAAALAGLAVSAFALRHWRSHPYLAFGWAYFLGTLVPVIGIVQVGSQAHADRYMYLPLVGLAVMLCFGADHVLERTSERIRATAAATALLALLVLGVRTADQVQHWRSSEAVFARAIEVRDRNWLAHHSYGQELEKRGQIERALVHYREALRFQPGWDAARRAVETRTALLEELARFREAVERDPDSALAHFNLSTVYTRMFDHETGRAHLERALALDPDFALAHMNLGGVLMSAGHFAEAREHFETAATLQPDDWRIRYGLAGVLVELGELDDAIAIYEALHERRPEDGTIRAMLEFAREERARNVRR